jgi:Sulfotransferase family
MAATRMTGQGHAIQASPGELMATARQLTGVEFVDRDIEEALAILLRSLNTEAQLSEEGARAMTQRVLRILCNRLRMERDYRAHPKIEEQKIVRPLILTGGGRTGSTKLHLLLAASGDFKFIPLWQNYTLSLRTGDRHEDPAPRIRDTEEFVRWFDARAPKARMIHAFDAQEPEEETHLYEQAAFGFYLFAFAFIPSFMQWFATQDFRRHVVFFRRALKYLQWQFHDGDTRPWVLKYPAYQGCEPLLREFFRDAVFVATWRDPVSTLTSSCSLFSAWYEAYSDANFDQILGPMMLEGQAQRIQMQIDARRERPDIRVFDIAYADLTRSSEQVVKNIYGHAGLPLSDRAKQAMRAWDRDNAQHKHGAHQYVLAQFGLTREIAEARYRDYSDAYGKLF